MMDKSTQIASKLLRMEANALFATVQVHTNCDQWWFFAEARAAHLPIPMDKHISDYRAWMSIDYQLCSIPVSLYLERELHQSWTFTIHVEGKANEKLILEWLTDLTKEGFDIGDGNENLTRQMNFSLGLYGACLMHIVLYPPQDKSVMDSTMALLNYLDSINRAHPQKISIATEDDDYGFDDNVLFGDWQTWK